MSYVPDETLADLVGSARVSSQLEWLSERGWRFETRRDGRPRVAWAEHDHHMVSSSQTQLKDVPKWEPRA